MEAKLVLLEPLALIGWGLALLAAYALWRRAAARWGLLCITSFYFWFATPLGANAMLGYFEHHTRTVAACNSSHDAWIVVLAGGIDDEAREVDAWERLAGPSLKRTLRAARLALAEPDRRVLLIGGAGNGVHEADVMASLLVALGVDRGRLVVDSTALNTRESAVHAAAELARASAGRDPMLVTSALHMVRASEAFESEGLRVCPRPVDFRWVSPPARHALIPQASSVAKSNATLHEALGLLYYRLSARWSAAQDK